MRTLKLLALAALLAAGVNSILSPAQAQSESVAAIKATADAIQTLQDQQKTIADNQAKIDTKLATIAENVRVARLYAARAR
jgi:ribosomal protein S5